jgi:hypothetical protein
MFSAWMPKAGSRRRCGYVMRCPVGKGVTLDLVLDAPSAAGTYIFRMFQHGVELFGEELAIEVLPQMASVPAENWA